MKRSLPLYVERVVQQNRLIGLEIADRFERQLLGNEPLSCHSGCSACCYHPLRITILEGIPLYRTLVDEGSWTPSLKEQLRKTARMTMGLAPHVWLQAKIACPLLDTTSGKCKAYEARPFVCRITFATGDPHYCDAHHIGDTSIVPRQTETKQFHVEEERFLRNQHLTHLLLPVGTSVLLAERVVQGGIKFEDVDRTWITEYLTERSE